MSKRAGLHLTFDQVAQHQRKHGFVSDIVIDGRSILAGAQEAAARPSAAAKLGMLRRKRMTRAESEFELILRDRFRGAQVLFEAYTLRLADDCRYTPDFAVVIGLMIDFYEVKGSYIFPKAIVKPRIAAEMFPQHQFFVAQKLKHGWEEYQLRRRRESSPVAKGAAG